MGGAVRVVADGGNACSPFLSLVAKVCSYLQWAKCARAAAGAKGKLPLFVNMDETSVAYCYGTGKGLVVSKRVLPSGKFHKKSPATSSDHKTHVSYLAFVTHDSAIQPKLPQIFIGNKKAFLLKTLNALAPDIPEGFFVWREESSWNNHVLMCRALRILADRLKDYKDSHQIILILDVARCHRHPLIYSWANRLGIILMYVPAKLTWLLQPADTHVFGRMKTRLRQLWIDLCVQSDGGVVAHAQWLAAAFDLIRKLLCGFKWHNAFLSNGLLDENKIGSRILQELQYDVPKPLQAAILTPEELQGLMPRRTKNAHAKIFSWALPKAMPKAMPKAKSKAKAKAKAAPAAIAWTPGPISSGTRSKKKL